MRTRAMGWRRWSQVLPWLHWRGECAASERARRPSVQGGPFSLSPFSISSSSSPYCWPKPACSGVRREEQRPHAGEDMAEKPERIVLTEEQKRTRRARSIAIALALGALVILFYIVTLVKGPAVLNRPL